MNELIAYYISSFFYEVKGVKIWENILKKIL